MAIQWHYVNDYVAFGVDWGASSSATEVTAKIKVYRWDRWLTDNTGCTLTETLSPDPYGGGGPWHPSLKADTAQNQTKVIDTFNARTYAKKTSKQTVRLTISWDESFGSWYGGSFHYLGAGSHTFTMEVPALASYQVKYSANGGAGAPAAQTKWHGQALKLSAAQPTRAHHTFGGWGTSSSAETAKYQPGGTYTANASATLYAIWRVVAPAAPKGCSSKRIGDNRNDVSWVPGDGAAATYSAVLVERSVNGGAWSQVASAAGSATSWSDASASANNSYRYRVRASNATGKSAYSTSGTTYNTPAAPASVTASRTGEASVALSIDNPANTATAIEIQRSADKAFIAATIALDGKVTSAEDAPGGGTWHYRARNTRGDLLSAWSPWSAPVVTVCPPEAPTPLSPAQGSVVSKADGTVSFSWAHNAPDGSEQTAAELQHSADGGGSWQTAAVEGAVKSAVIENAFAVNASVSWRVRTKGADPSWSAWSSVSTFRVAQVPSVAFSAPAMGAVIEGTPIAVQLDYTDASGSLAACALTVEDSMGAQVYTLDMGTATSASIASSEWLPDNGGSYTLRASVRSTSGLSASAERDVSVSFVEPQGAVLELTPDAETGAMGIQIGFEPLGDLQPALGASVWRVNEDGSRTLLADGMTEGAYIEDAYAPLNTEYAYDAATVADSGAVRRTSAAALLATPYSFFLHADGAAKAKLRPEGDLAIDRPERKLNRYVGRRLPVCYDSDAVAVSASFSASLKTRAEERAFRSLMESGRCVYKSVDGDVMRAACKVSFSKRFTEDGYASDVSIDLEEIDGGAL